MAGKRGKRPGADGNGGQTGQSRSRRKHPGKRATPGDSVRLYGLHTVRAALLNPKRKAIRLYVTENARNRLGDVVDGLDLPVEMCDSRSLQPLAGRDAVHQGVVLECAPLQAADQSELFTLVDARLVLALDQITDPHNAGAILRSAVAMDVDAVLMTHRHSPQESGVLAKSASGALDHVRLFDMRNLSKGLAELNEMGFATIGLDSEGETDFPTALTDAGDRPVVLVAGSEGRGLREQTRAACSSLARLDMPGPIKSLNVSNAVALSLYLAARHTGKAD